MQCNIDSRGKAMRLILGLAMLAGALVVALLAGLGVVGLWAWAVALALFGLGAFGVFEGWAGWCAVRAMGFRTRI